MCIFYICRWFRAVGVILLLQNNGCRAMRAILMLIKEVMKNGGKLQRTRNYI